jgi:hypothetical protein
MFPNWHRVCMLVSELHRACILNFALDRVRVRVVYEIPNKTVLISQCSRSKVMPKFETVPGERSASIISSIINLVCPRCGGSMMEFQCNGGCKETGCLNGSGQTSQPRAGAARVLIERNAEVSHRVESPRCGPARDQRITTCEIARIHEAACCCVRMKSPRTSFSCKVPR